MRALVVGGTGFLGLNLVEALQQGGHEVAITRRKSSNTIFARRLKVPLFTAELDDEEALTAAMQGRDVVFMMAGHYPRFSVDTAAQTAQALARLRTVLAAARRARVQRLVFTSSTATLGTPAEDRPVRESDGFCVPEAESTYFVIKVALEQEVLRAAQDLDTVVVCPGGCIGRYDYKVGTGFFILGVATQRLDRFVDGKVSMVDAADIAAGHIGAARHGARGQRYILGGTNLTVKSLLAEVAAHCGVAPPTWELSPAEALAWAEAEEQRCLLDRRERPLMTREMVDIARFGRFVDASLARQTFGYTPRPLAQALQRSLAWYAENGYWNDPRFISASTTRSPLAALDAAAQEKGEVHARS